MFKQNPQKPHQRIWLKFHKCRSFKTPVGTKRSPHRWLMSWARPDLGSVPTPDKWVVHTRLVIAQSDEWCVWRPPVNQVQQNLLVVDSQVVHVLWIEWGSNSQTAIRRHIRTVLYWSGALGQQLTGPKVGVGAHHAQDQWAGYPPGQWGAVRERPSDLQRHRSIKGTTSNLTC